MFNFLLKFKYKNYSNESERSYFLTLLTEQNRFIIILTIMTDFLSGNWYITILKTLLLSKELTYKIYCTFVLNIKFMNILF